MLDLLGDDRDELDGAGAGPDDGDPLAGEVVAVVPPGRVEAVAGEGVDPLDPRIGLTVELTGRDDQRLALPAPPVGAGGRPNAPLLVPAALDHLDAGDDPAVDPAVACDLAQVAEDVVARRAEPLPVAALVERERVEVAGNVAGGAGVVVVVPRPAELGGAVEQRDLIEAVRLQLHAGGDPAEAGADDDDPGTAHGGESRGLQMVSRASPPSRGCTRRRAAAGSRPRWSRRARPGSRDRTEAAPASRTRRTGLRRARRRRGGPRAGSRGGPGPVQRARGPARAGAACGRGTRRRAPRHRPGRGPPAPTRSAPGTANSAGRGARRPRRRSSPGPRRAGATPAGSRSARRPRSRRSAGSGDRPATALPRILRWLPRAAPAGS